MLALLIFHLVASSITFAVYAADKSAARTGQRRKPERTLHLLALIGGWPGALAAQKLLHHKTRKQPFQGIFWITVALHSGVLGWLIWSYSA